MARCINKWMIAGSLSLFLLYTGGCSLVQSPAVGHWTGTMRPSAQSGIVGGIVSGVVTAAFGNAPATLELNSNGTGYMKLPISQEKPITWKADGDKIILSGIPSDYTASPSPDASPGPDDTSAIGTLSQDKQSLTIDFGPMEVDLTRQK